MRALFVESPGRPPTLVVRDVPVPQPGPGEVLVRVAACGFCHHDLLVMSGALRRGVRRDVILGHEISGVVAEAGPDVASLHPGDRVVSLLTNACGRCGRCASGREHRCRNGEGIGHRRDGGFAEYVSLSENSLVRLAPDADLLGASLYACPMGVALQGVQEAARVQTGETVLVTGAGGGLGTHAVQFAAALGARVMAVTSSPDKLPGLEELGAEQALESGLAPGNGDAGIDFAELALALTEEEGVDVVIDTVGSPLFPYTWRCQAQFGRLVMLGEVSGRPVELNLAEVIFRDARIIGSSGVSSALVRQVAVMVARGEIRPVVSHTLPLEEAATAFEVVSSRKALGRVALSFE